MEYKRIQITVDGNFTKEKIVEADHNETAIQKLLVEMGTQTNPLMDHPSELTLEFKVIGSFSD